MRKILIVFYSLITVLAYSQDGWEWEFLGIIPEPVSNNAVTEAYRGDSLCYYSFTGIGSDLDPQAIHLKSWRYNTVNDEWQALPDVDDFRGKIAAGASTVKNIIYLVGGYHVFDNFSEQTSPKVHRFDPETNTWLSDGQDVPVPIDDHVQAVWRDSLIFVVTGWSQNTNTASVQIYNPALDEWSAGTSVPPTNNFRAFGASGTIIGDTIYYFGGTQISGFNFVANKKFRKGIINPENPNEIVWEFLGDADALDNGYRMAASSFQNEAIWFGGSGIAYNFDALAYSNNQTVNPLSQIRWYDTVSEEWFTAENSPFPIMDLRGIAREDEDSWIIIGGITNERQVSDQMWRITRATVNATFEKKPSVCIKQTDNSIKVSLINSGKISAVNLYDRMGRRVGESSTSDQNEFVIDKNDIIPGIYILQLEIGQGRISTEKIFIY